MNTLRRLEVEAFFLILIAIAAGLTFFLYRDGFPFKFNVAASLPSVQMPSEVVAPKVTETSQISPDGEKFVIMTATENSDGITAYQISTENADGTNKIQVYTQNLDSTRNMSVPYNTWSPDDKYFFVQENFGKDKRILVFQATGEPFSQEEPYLDAASIFKAKETGNIFDEATGWASETLIIINTVKKDGSKGYSYWFEVPSKAVIQLSTDF